MTETANLLVASDWNFARRFLCFSPLTRELLSLSDSLKPSSSPSDTFCFKSNNDVNGPGHVVEGVSERHCLTLNSLE